MAEYAAGKNMTLRQLLTANGYNMSRIPKDAIMITSDAWSDVDEKYGKTWNTPASGNACWFRVV